METRLMQNARTSDLRGLALPRIMYGTAWKEDRTKPLVLEAIAAGFRAFDTANQRKHYVEEEVGAAVRTATASGTVTREDLFLQTKFTYQRGQDHRLPYDPACDLTTQVRQSIASSFEHLGVTRIDSYILHGPSHGLVGWAKPIGRHGVRWKTQSMKAWLACSESVMSLSISSMPSSVARG